MARPDDFLSHGVLIKLVTILFLHYLVQFGVTTMYYNVIRDGFNNYFEFAQICSNSDPRDGVGHLHRLRQDSSISRTRLL